ncbi:MAG: RtcB family protein, partial [Chloroflexi bacterium]|nr:RtcB family protein [Chloroflexota bacterium]
MFRMIDGIPVWGDPDPGAVEQIKRCVQEGHAAAGALMADHHKGYSQPIGGVVAYENAISPSGVGYDIACLAAGTPVTTRDGYFLPVESVPPSAPVLEWGIDGMGELPGNLGTFAKGRRATLAVTLANGRTLTLTDDHLVLTPDGWRPAGALAPGDELHCNPHVGLPFEPTTAEIPLELPVERRRQLEALRLVPLRLDHPLLPAIVRLLAYVSGDGHLARNGKRIAIYTTEERDAAALAADLGRLGARPSIRRRQRAETTRPKIQVLVDSVPLHALFAALGSPVGKKVWPGEPMPWLLAAPAWVRGNFISAFGSAEMMTPCWRLNGELPNLALKQAGENANAIGFIQRLLESLGYVASVAPRGVPRGERLDYVLQILGGTAEQLRYFEEIGFCYSWKKRCAAAAAASVAWQGQATRTRRDQARAETKELLAAGVGRREVLATVSARFEVTEAFVHHSMHDRVDRVCRTWNANLAPRTVDELCWFPITRIEPAGAREVYDVHTVDGTHNFLAAGVVVHNCGNKAVLTNLRGEGVRPEIKPIMDSIFKEVQFGIGRTYGKELGHPVFDDPTWKDVPVLKPLKQLARQQLGTVGSGNHYVDLFVDEEERVWVGVHFGSRGFGHKTASGFLNLAAGRAFDAKAPGESMDQLPTVLSLEDPVGQDYLAAMELAGKYAYAGRDSVVEQVLRILGAHAVEEVHNHHNFCVPGNAIVATSSGPRPMAEIRPGDCVYAFDERVGLVKTRVTDHWCSGTQPIYVIETSNRRLRVSGSHPVLSISIETQPHPERPWMSKRVGHYLWKQAVDIKPGDIIVCAEGCYEEELSLGVELARFIGAFLGDGWVRHAGTEIRGYSLGLAVGGPAEAHTDRYATLCRSLFPDARWKTSAPGAFGITCSSREVARELKEWGITGRSRERSLPRAAFMLPRNERLALLAGYFDADGSVAGNSTQNHGRGTIASVNHQLVTELRELAISCGLRVTPVRADERNTNFGPSTVFRCTVSADSIGQLELWHEVKASKARSTKFIKPKGLEASKVGYLNLPTGVFAQRVRTVECIEPALVYDLSVDHPSHSFVCDGVVVHNCWLEEHSGRKLYVVRKGSTPNLPGQRSFVGGSMGDISVIIEGVDTEESRLALSSTVHGAGRTMSRTQAAGKVKWVRGRPTRVRGGQITREMMLEWVRRGGVELRGAGTDESPHVYKRLPEV